MLKLNTCFQIVPEGLRLAVNWIKDHYGNPEIFITENGYGSVKENSLEDHNRIYYFTVSLLITLFLIK